MALFDAVCLYKKGRVFFRFGQRSGDSSFPCHFFSRCVYKKRFCKIKTCFFKRTCGKLRTPCCVPTKQLMLKHQPTFNSANVTFFEMVKTVSDRERQKTGFPPKIGDQVWSRLETAGMCGDSYKTKLNKHHENLRDATPQANSRPS